MVRMRYLAMIVVAAALSVGGGAAWAASGSTTTTTPTTTPSTTPAVPATPKGSACPNMGPSSGAGMNGASYAPSSNL
jgi:hypothetical protein